MPRQWKFYSMIMLAALTLGAISGGLLGLVGGGSEATAQANMVASANFGDAAFLVADDGTYAGGLLAPDGSGQVVYISANGDSIAGIASRFGVSPAALAAANGMNVNEHLSGGEQLIIPAATQLSAAQSAPSTAKVNPAAAPQSAAKPPAAQQPAAQQPAQRPAASPPALDQHGDYTIQPGDTLSGIAARFGVSVSDLANANSIVSLSQIYSGAKLTIPAKGQQAGSSSSGQVSVPQPQLPTTQPAASASQAVTPGKYTVQAGDNLSTIAANHGVSMDALINANSLTDANMIYVGQSLIIPGTSQPVSQSEPVRQQPAQAWPKPALDTPTPSPSTPTLSAPDNHWIDVNISTETLTAYEGDVAVFRSAVSTGIASHPTVIGRYAIYVKLASTPMSGPGYYLPDVPYTMYFYAGYGIHGTYWHHNFGHPMSHGCVNLPTPAAKWLFDWASVGTPVVTHY